MRVGTGIKAGTGKLTGSRYCNGFFTFLHVRLYEGGMFFVPSQMTGIPFELGEIPAARDDFLL